MGWRRGSIQVLFVHLKGVQLTASAFSKSKGVFGKNPYCASPSCSFLTSPFQIEASNNAIYEIHVFCQILLYAHMFFCFPSNVSPAQKPFFLV